ncbi:unnamed protein product [Candida parapsilosis]
MGRNLNEPSPACDSKSYYESSKSPKALIFYLINTSLPNSRDFKHVLALELPRLSK